MAYRIVGMKWISEYMLNCEIENYAKGSVIERRGERLRDETNPVNGRYLGYRSWPATRDIARLVHQMGGLSASESQSFERLVSS